jgi:peptidoglycan/xylan/chitin deacetylase (PgdA/CDA1 family)
MTSDDTKFPRLPIPGGRRTKRGPHQPTSLDYYNCDPRLQRRRDRIVNNNKSAPLLQYYLVVKRMLVVSPLLKRVVYPALHHSGWLDHVSPVAGYAIVNYHGVLPSGYSSTDTFLDGSLVQPEVFRQQLQFLKAHYQIIHPEDFRASIEQDKPLPPRAVLLTCDDGLVNTLTDMLPVLQSENVPCLFFVTSASCCDQPGILWFEELYQLMRINPLIGLDPHLLGDEGAARPASGFQSLWWNTVRKASRWDATTRANWINRARISCGPMPSFSSDRRWRLLSNVELKQLADAGMSIGAHTRSHTVLSVCSDEESRREIQDSKNDIERVLGMPVWAFAYPFGGPSTVSERELRLAQETGFSCAFVNVEHWDTGCSNSFAVERTHVTSDMTLSELAAHLSGVHKRLQRSVAR